MDKETEQLLRTIAATLNDWAYESRRYGWSTHQVKPQLALAKDIYVFLGRKTEEVTK